MKPASTSRTPPRRRDEARALFRDGILDAAESVFSESGFHAARIQDIAEHARIAVGTVYNHFDTKEDILRALLDERTEELLANVRAIPGDPADFSERLTRRLERLLGFIDRHRSFFAVATECGLVSGSPNGEMRDVVGRSVKMFERFRAAFRGLVQEGIDEGALAPLETRHLAAFLGGTIRAFVTGARTDGETDVARYAPLLARLFLHGAAASPAPAGRHGSRR